MLFLLQRNLDVMEVITWSPVSNSAEKFICESNRIICHKQRLTDLTLKIKEEKYLKQPCSIKMHLFVD